MHERKALMADLADGFLAIPGGAGTLEEFFEVWTWAQLGIHRKPCGVLNVHGYFDGLLTFLDHAVDRAVPPRRASRDGARGRRCRPPAGALRRLPGARRCAKWIDRNGDVSRARRFARSPADLR